MERAHTDTTLAADAVALCEAFRVRHGLPGIAAALVRGDAILWLGGFGAADLEHDAPVTLDTPFEIASVTKLFTAQATLALADEGLIDLDAPFADRLELAVELLMLP
jgi:CubicO group peptidase (beta-lactamase class C family)